MYMRATFTQEWGKGGQKLLRDALVIGPLERGHLLGRGHKVGRMEGIDGLEHLDEEGARKGLGEDVGNHLVARDVLNEHVEGKP